MTDARGRPDVMHRPDHWFSASQDLMDGVERKHTLVDPVKMNQIRLLELAQFRDVTARIGNVDLEEMFLGKMQSAEDDQPLPEEMPTEHHRFGQSDYRQRVRLLVTYQHLRLDTIVVESHHQTVGCYGSATRPFTGIDNQDPHD